MELDQLAARATVEQDWGSSGRGELSRLRPLLDQAEPTANGAPPALSMGSERTRASQTQAALRTQEAVRMQADSLEGESFDALFTSMILKEMRQSMQSEDSFFAGDHGDVVGGIWDQFLGEQMAPAMNFGMDELALSQLPRAGS